MSLQDQLDAFKAQFKVQAPEGAFDAFARSTQELIDSGQAERAVKAGEKAPDFELTDQDGNSVALQDLLTEGPVVLSFYRGVWCPYCNIELKALEEAVGEQIRARGASLVAISMQGASDSRKAQRDNELTFPHLDGHGRSIGRGVWHPVDPAGLCHQVPQDVRGRAASRSTMTVEWNLPMPARYVIATDGTVAYAEVNPDYTRRPDPSELIPVLDKLSTEAAA